MKIIYGNWGVKNYVKEDHRTYTLDATFVVAKRKLAFCNRNRDHLLSYNAVFVCLFVCLFALFNISVLCLLTWCTI